MDQKALLQKSYELKDFAVEDDERQSPEESGNLKFQDLESGKQVINLTQNVNNINNITNIIINTNPVVEAKEKADYDIVSFKKKENSEVLNPNKEKAETSSNKKLQMISPVNENLSKKVFSEDSKFEYNYLRRSSSSSFTTPRSERMSFANEDGALIPFHDFYDEFNKEIILTDYFSRFLALSIAIYEDEISKKQSIDDHKLSFENKNTKPIKSRLFNENFDNNSDYKKRLTNEETSSPPINDIIPKLRISVDGIVSENNKFNPEVEYKEYSSKNIPERFKSQRIGSYFDYKQANL